MFLINLKRAGVGNEKYVIIFLHSNDSHLIYTFSKRQIHTKIGRRMA